MSKTIEGVIGFVNGTTAASNYIKQISDGSVTHDVAVQNGITFFSGANDPNGIEWDGRQPLEVVIPSVSDIISSPIVFAGTVGSDGEVSYASGFGPDPAKGYLVYITDDCTFASEVCEGGDMAVYDGTAWRVIQGENQVALVGTADNSGNIDVLLSGTVAEVLDVEGKHLRLGLDYDDVRNHISKVLNANNEISIANGTVTVDPMYIGLSYTAGTPEDITTSVSIDLPTALASGDVTISNKVLASGDFTFTSGSFPELNKNADALSITASHNMSISKSDTAGDFVTSVTAIKSVSFNGSGSSSTDFGVVTGLSAKTGTSFLTGVHSYDSTKDAGQTAAFTLWGQVTVSNSTFVSGLGEANAAGANALVADVSIGNVGLDSTGSGILTGLSTGSDVVTDLSFGNVAQDTTTQWFFSGLGEGSDVVTGVTVGAVTLASDSNSTFAGSAITTASVSNHVLSFTTANFMTPVAISQASSTVTKGGFSKSGVKLENTSVSKGGFTTAALSQPTVTVSYKSILTGNVGLSQSSVDWYYDKAEEHDYEAVMDYVYLSTAAADVTKNAATIANPTVTVSIPANTFGVSLTSGTLPSLSIGAPSATISGTVGTSLTTSSVSWLAVDSAKKEVTSAGTYELVSASTSAAGMIEVAKADTYDLDDATVTIASGTYVTDLMINNTSIGNYVPNA